MVEAPMRSIDQENHQKPPRRIPTALTDRELEDYGPADPEY